MFFIILFCLCAFIIFWAMIGYPLSLLIISKLYKDANKKDYNYLPTVTLMVVAHNEEKVILEKLENMIKNVYPKDKISYIIVSDNSTDKTNSITNGFIKKHPEYSVRLYEVKKRQGKTYAQNEARKSVNSEILIMTDANSMFDTKAVSEIVASFSHKDVAYVCGKLVYVNTNESIVSKSEKTYWDADLKYREIESNIKTITAGNGAIYACRTDLYFDFPPIECHDSSMPLYFAMSGKRAIYNADAVAFERAGKTIKEEFGRKVRMNRTMVRGILNLFKVINIFKYTWFTYFYFGHRTCRYLLWISHLLILIACGVLINYHCLFAVLLGGQLLFYILGLTKVVTKTSNKWINMIFYYCMTVCAQWAGIYRTITGKSKAYWEKAETTR